jgi:hypothetical protein
MLRLATWIVGPTDIQGSCQFGDQLCFSTGAVTGAAGYSGRRRSGRRRSVIKDESIKRPVMWYIYNTSGHGTSLSSVLHPASSFQQLDQSPNMVLRPSQPIAKKCLTCPSFLTGKCTGTAVASATHGQIRPMATETPAGPVRNKKQQGDISSAFTTFSGRQATPLPERFRDLKRNLTAGFEQQIQKSWDDLVEELKVRTEEVASQRDKVSFFFR